MGDKTQTLDDHRNVVFGSGSDHSRVLDIYPLSGYYFGSKEAVVLRNETSAERVLRMKSNHAARGMRTSVEAILMVELFKHPHLLLLQIKNSIFKLPGGRLRPGESEIEGLQRKLSRKLSVADSSDKKEWEHVGDCLGVWWRPDFETSWSPYLPPNVKDPKTYGPIISATPELLSRVSFNIVDP